MIHLWLYNLRISLTDLPRTFADAVKITRQFEIRYLWIDSLCIIDNEEDWRRESASMNKVYRNSWLNIAATGFQDPNGGCFFNREPTMVEPLSIDVPSWCKDSKQERLPFTKYLCIDFDIWTCSIDESPLGGRAWAVQERFLSPRQIHFGSQQLFWECRENTACETLQGGLPQRLTGAGKSGHLKAVAKELHELCIASTTKVSDKSSPFLGLRTVQTCPEVSKIWGDLVDHYSGCALTFGPDKLVAISGIVQEIQRAIADEYLAGMWRSDLAHSLVWTRVGPGDTQRWRPRPLRAPN